MKQGSKVLCIKSIKNRDGDILYTKNKTYIVKNVYSQNQFYIIDNFGETGTAFYSSYIHKYFVSLQKARQQKLEKLNRENNENIKMIFIKYEKN